MGAGQRRPVVRQTEYSAGNSSMRQYRAFGSVIGGVVTGAIVAYFSAAYLTIYAITSGRIKLFEYPVVQPTPWTSLEYWILGISLTLGISTAILVSRHLFRESQAESHRRNRYL